MKELRYKLIGSYTLGEGQVLTCDRCGKAIKNVYTIIDTLTGELLNVGSTCIDKVLTIENMGRKKALIKEIEKLGKLIQNARESIKTSVIDLYNEEIEKGDYKTQYNTRTYSQGLTKFDVYYNIIDYRWYQLSRVIKEQENLVKITNGEVNYDIEDLRKELEIVDTEINIIGVDNKNKILPYVEELEKETAEEEQGVNEFIGKVKERIILKLKVIDVNVIDGYYGETFEYDFVTEDNKKVFWKSSKNMNFNKNDMVTLKGTIKENNKSTNTTILTRCKMV